MESYAGSDPLGGTANALRRELLAEAALDADVRTRWWTSLAKHGGPSRANLVGRLIEAGDVKEALDRVTPSELFIMARDMAPKRKPDGSCVLAELRQLAQRIPKQINYAAISRAFGTPKPTLANSYRA